MSRTRMAMVFAVSVLCSLTSAGDRRTCPGQVSADRNQFRPWPPAAGRRGRPTAPASPLRSGSFGDAFMVDTGLTLRPASGSQYSYGAASNGNGWLVLWIDRRDQSMRTTRIGPDCSLRDTAGRVVGHSWSYRNGVTQGIVGTGAGFMAVWLAGDEWPQGVWAARLDPDGRLVDSFLVYHADYEQAEPVVAFDGDSTCLVVWAGDPSGTYQHDIFASRVTVSGQVLDPDPLRLTQGNEMDESGPAVAFGRGVFLVSWNSADSIFSRVKARRVSGAGQVLDTAVLLRRDSAMMQAYSTLTFGDTCFLAAWCEGWDEPDVYAARISSAGRIIDSGGVRLSSTTSYDVFPSAGFDGSRYLVFWSELDPVGFVISLRGRRMTTGGVPLDSALIRPAVGGHFCFYPSLAFDAANFLVAFDVLDTMTNDEDIGCLRVSTAGSVLDTGLFFPLGAQEQFGPRGAFDGERFLAVWLETSKHGCDVQAARILPDGTVLDPTGFAVCDAAGYKYAVSVGFGDSLYLVAWADQRGGEGDDVYCARVTRDGRSLDPDGILVSDEMTYGPEPGVGWDGQNFLVVWQDDRNGMDNDIYAARVSPAGIVLDPDGFAVDADTDAVRYPAVCFNGADYLVVWEGLNRVTWDADLYGALVSPAGTITRPKFTVSSADYDQRMPAIAHGPTSSLVTWQDGRVSGGSDIFAARITPAGTVLDPNGRRIGWTGNYEEMPRVVYGNGRYSVFWRYMNIDSALVVGAEVDTGAIVLRTFAVPDLPVYQYSFDAATGDGDDLLLLFDCWTDTAMGRNYFNQRVWGKLGPFIGVAESPKPQAASPRLGPTIIRGVLFLPANGDGRRASSELLDITGRKVQELVPGPNNVSRLAPGVYFVRSETRSRQSEIAKVTVTR